MSEPSRSTKDRRSTDGPVLDERLHRLADLVAAPAFIVPWLDRFYDADEVDLVLEAADGLLPGARDRDQLTRSHRRAVLDEQDDVWTPATFHARYELWALYEDWRDVPAGIRDLLNEWELADYLVEVGEGIAAVRDGRNADGDQQDYTYLLLAEAEALLRQQRAIYLWPCNCRAMMGRCEHSHAVCLRFENDRDVGWEITPERAVAILRQADREGLMHTAYLSSTHGHHGICNCCNDCCFPILAGERLDAADLWPVRRHVAVIDAAGCTRCRRCVKRCPFGAVSIGTGEGRPTLVDSTVCRGCGLCASACEQGAIGMDRRPEPLRAEQAG
jgi:Pyruvate/2-oxoacid:ferredoxin oxidoreductase delta subunit